jgi:hypothetical protein
VKPSKESVERQKKAFKARLAYEKTVDNNDLSYSVNFDTSMLDLKEVLNKQIIDICLHKDNDGEELQIMLEDGKQIEICLLDNGKIHIQSD